MTSREDMSHNSSYQVLIKGDLFPSLLLHNLGHTSHDPGLAERLKNIFWCRCTYVCDVIFAAWRIVSDLLKAFFATRQDRGKHVCSSKAYGGIGVCISAPGASLMASDLGI